MDRSRRLQRVIEIESDSGADCARFIVQVRSALPKNIFREKSPLRPAKKMLCAIGTRPALLLSRVPQVREDDENEATVKLNLSGQPGSRHTELLVTYRSWR